MKASSASILTSSAIFAQFLHLLLAPPHLPHHLNFTVASPNAAHSAEINQNRTTTCCSLHPLR
jgi:hypothetical protein